ncbi:MAG: type I-U CRISPR-associated protein Csb2 [Tepidisphaeraceae bacterium]
MSLSIGIRFLTGYCVAARSKTDPRPEWPPHPARLFMALAAAYFECDGGDAERAALAWLESLAAPQLTLPAAATVNEAIPVFVPTNDRTSLTRGGSIQTLPALKRHRAERLFPRTHLPDDADSVYLQWPDADEAGERQHRAALGRLCGQVSRLGHSSSLVQVWQTSETPTDGWRTLEPSDTRSGERLRVVSRTAGTLERLEIAYQTPPYRYEHKAAQTYVPKAEADAAAAVTVFDPRLEVFALQSVGSSPRWLQLETTLALTTTLRRAILERCPQPVPESISGHADGGAPTQRPHIALLPLGFVGREHADGHLLGVAVALPREMSEADQEKLAEALDHIADEDSDAAKERFKKQEGGLTFAAAQFPGLGSWRPIRPSVLDDSRVNLRPETWTAAARRGRRTWASVTPIVFDQHAKARSKAGYLDECTRLIAEAAKQAAGGAAVVGVDLTPISLFAGAPGAHAFPRLRRKDGSQRRQTHAVITFDRDVVGPLLIGAGRFRGYGLMRPLDERTHS